MKSTSKLIHNGETETVEFKESLDRQAIETLCAFANTKGGMLFLGVNDDGIPIGLQAGKNTLTDWANQIAQGTGLHPSIKAETHSLPWQGVRARWQHNAPNGDGGTYPSDLVSCRIHMG